MERHLHGVAKLSLDNYFKNLQYLLAGMNE